MLNFRYGELEVLVKPLDGAVQWSEIVHVH